MIRFQRYALLVLALLLAFAQTADAGPFDRETFTNKTIDGRYNRIVNVPTTALVGNLAGNSFINPVITVSGATTGTLYVYDANAGNFTTLPQGANGTLLRVNNGSGALGYERLTQWQPEDNGLISANFDPALVSAVANAQTTSTIYKIKVGSFSIPRTITNIVYVIGACGSTLTTGQNYLALYQGNTVIATTADQTAAWNTGCTLGAKSTPLTTPVVISAGDLYVGVLGVGTTITRFDGSAITAGTSANINLAAGSGRYLGCNVSTSFITTSGCGNSSLIMPWFGVS